MVQYFEFFTLCQATTDSLKRDLSHPGLPHPQAAPARPSHSLKEGLQAADTQGGHCLHQQSDGHGGIGEFCFVGFFYSTVTVFTDRVIFKAISQVTMQFRAFDQIFDGYGRIGESIIQFHGLALIPTNWDLLVSFLTIGSMKEFF